MGSEMCIRDSTYMMYDVDYQTNANALYEFIYN